MPLRRHKASIKFVKGVQQKVDHKVVPADSLVTLENGRFDKVGAINKRTGYTFIDKEASDLIGYKNTLVARNTTTGDRLGTGILNRASAYSASSGNFIGDATVSGHRGFSDGIDYTSIPVSKGSQYQQRNPNVAISSDGKYACVTFVDVSWNITDRNRLHDKRLSIIDRENNTVLVRDVKLGSATNSGNNGRRMVPLWVANKFYVFGEDEGALKFWIIDPTGATIQVKNAAGSATAAGEEILATANYPLAIGAADTGYTNAQASFDACNSSTSTKALLFATHVSSHTYTVKYYIFDTSDHGITEKWSASVTGTTSQLGHLVIHRSGVSGDHSAKVAFAWQNGTTFTIGTCATEAATSTTDSTITIGANRIVRGSFLDDINPFSEQDDQDACFIHEESEVITAISNADESSHLYIAPDIFKGIPGYKRLLLAYKQRFIFAFGRSPHTIGTVHDDNPAGLPWSDPPVNTVALWDWQRTVAIGGGSYGVAGHSVNWIRDHLPIASFDPAEYIDSDKIKTASYSGGTEGLKGSVVALPVATHQERFSTVGDFNPLNSVIRLFDFRRVNEELVDTPAPSSAVVQDILYVADKGLHQYDGDRFRSVGFIDRPMLSGVLGSAGGNLTANGVYYWKLVYEWEDAQGNLHQSEPSGAITVTAEGSGGSDKRKVTLKIVTNNLPDFGEKEVQVAIYRTQANGSIFNHVRTQDLVTTTGFISFEDNIDDINVASGKFLYTDSGELANLPPPASARYVAAHRDRLWVIGKDDVVYYSKLIQDGFGVGFNDALFIKTPDNISDPPTALGSMDGNLFIFTENSIYIVGGEGPDNLGSGGFYETKRVPSNIGATKGSPVKLINDGLIFISKKGTHSKICLLGRNMAVTYMGAAIENIISPPEIAGVSDGIPYIVKDITVDTAQETVLFLLSKSSGTPSGVKMITYNYELKQWGADTILDTYSAGAGGSLAWSGSVGNKKLHIGLMKSSTTPRSYVETTGFLDNTVYVPMKIKTGWINLSGIQSYQRVYGFHILGETKDEHTLTVNVYYDYDTSSVGNSYTFNVDEQADDAHLGKLQFRGHLTKQKCQAIQFEILDGDNSGTDDNGYTITEIALDIGLKADGYKQNNAKLGSTSTIGSSS